MEKVGSLPPFTLAYLPGDPEPGALSLGLKQSWGQDIKYKSVISGTW